MENGLLTVRRPEDERASYQFSRVASAIAGASAGLRQEFRQKSEFRGFGFTQWSSFGRCLKASRKQVGRVTYVGGNQIADWLTGLDAELTPEHVAALGEAVRQLRG